VLSQLVAIGGVVTKGTMEEWLACGDFDEQRARGPASGAPASFEVGRLLAAEQKRHQQTGPEASNMVHIGDRRH
jgi:hypothetical protein